MIHIDRGRIQMPEILGPDPGAEGPRETQDAQDFYEMPLEKRRKRRYNFAAYRHRSVREALGELFHGKCAFCESQISPYGPVDVEHYRPMSGVVGETGQSYPDLYWWLANEWTNLYPACVECSRPRYQESAISKSAEPVTSGKGSRFPLVDESQRAALPGEEGAEEPLLLDPCHDEPEKHLVFTEAGSVASTTPKGQTTITVMGLNRADLVEARRGAARQVVGSIERVQRYRQRMIMETEGGPHWTEMKEELDIELEVLKEYTAPDQEYAGLKRQLVQAFLQDLEAAEPIPAFEPEELSWTVPPVAATETEQEQAQKAYADYQRSLEDYTLEEKGGEKQYLSQRRLIERIEISNLKALSDIELDLTRSQGGATPWLMLLGKNATGKSTVLQAVALALAGERYFTKIASECGIHPGRYVRRGCESGQVRIHLSGFGGPWVLTFYENAVEFEGSLGETSRVEFASDGTIQGEGGGWQAKVFVLGYGATRLLPGPSDYSSYGVPYSRVNNLFSPFTSLVDATSWLLGLSDERFLLTRLALKELLGLNEEDDIFPEEDRIMVRAHGTEVPLDLLSDGYQSVVALTVDILEIVFNIWPLPETAEGVVLLDEIGAHLHPSWKMRIVSSLRSFLPRMQFIVATHEPLCLRGLYDGEVAVMRRDANQVVRAITDLPSVQALRVDQLLTSEHFGLLTTRSLHIEEQFTEYYELLAKRSLTDEEKERREDLKSELERHDQLGRTRRERLMLEAIDRYLATEPESLGTPQAQTRRDELDQELDDILES